MFEALRVEGVQENEEGGVVVEDNKQCCLLLMDISSHFQV
jgi:hypothetical protein